jgi:NAD(P)-dependent dehydrogenase (short-subunit alcohol dehydrogenase family)
MILNGKFAQKTAVVTGAGSGIGREVALGLARDGAKVVIADLSLERAQAVAKEISDLDGTALPVQVDVADAELVRTMVAVAMEEFGQIDVLVSNAGWDKVMPFVNTDEDLWDRVIGINYRGHSRRDPAHGRSRVREGRHPRLRRRPGGLERRGRLLRRQGCRDRLLEGACPGDGAAGDQCQLRGTGAD